MNAPVNPHQRVGGRDQALAGGHLRRFPLPQVFLSIPITENMADGKFRDDRRLYIEGIIQSLRTLGAEVASAVLNEDWGKRPLTPPVFTAYDIQAIRDCDLLVVVVPERVSRDIYLEIGLAVAWGHPVWIFAAQTTRWTYMVEGMRDIGHVHLVRYEAEAQVPELIATTLANMIGRGLI